MLQIQVIGQLEFVHICGHPLYEDVNWNTPDVAGNKTERSSSSIWGCELKYIWRWRDLHWKSHPLYEDVNWNSQKNTCHHGQMVILYMRMWIEMFLCLKISRSAYVILYMRMWIEMLPNLLLLPCETVILYMRMWIEMQHLLPLPGSASSSSIWGCELKWI